MACDLQKCHDREGQKKKDWRSFRMKETTEAVQLDTAYGFELDRFSIKDIVGTSDETWMWFED